jgi:hypothetical protein
VDPKIWIQADQMVYIAQDILIFFGISHSHGRITQHLEGHGIQEHHLRNRGSQPRLHEILNRTLENCDILKVEVPTEVGQQYFSSAMADWLALKTLIPR